jgi:protein SCO1
VKLAVIFGGKRTVIAAVIVLALIQIAQAQHGGGLMTGGGGLPSTTLPPNLGDVVIDQKLGSQIPLDLAFRDESGRTVALKQYFQPGKPVLLTLVYYDCPMLCTEVLNGETSMLRILKFDPGKDFEVVTVSFDPREKPELAAAKKKVYMQRYGRNAAADGWHFLTGDQESITKLTNAVGFHYKWDDRLQQFAHATAIMVATPQGKLSHYFYGVEYSPKDVRLALVEASDDKIGNPVDQVLLYCYHYDPRTGRYGAVITRVMRVAGVLTILILGSFLLIMFRKDKSRPVDTREVVRLGDSHR